MTDKPEDAENGDWGKSNVELPQKISEVINTFVDGVVESYADTQFVRATALFVGDDKKLDIAVLGDMPDTRTSGRADMGDLLRDMARKSKPIAVMFFSEAWMINQDSFMEKMDLVEEDFDMDKEKGRELAVNLMMTCRRVYNELYGSIQRVPGASEGVFFSLDTIWGTYTKRFSIERDEDDKGTLVEMEGGWSKSTKDMALKGNFSNLLEPTPTI